MTNPTSIGEIRRRHEADETRMSNIEDHGGLKRGEFIGRNQQHKDRAELLALISQYQEVLRAIRSDVRSHAVSTGWVSASELYTKVDSRIQAILGE